MSDFVRYKGKRLKKAKQFINELIETFGVQKTFRLVREYVSILPYYYEGDVFLEEQTDAAVWESVALSSRSSSIFTSPPDNATFDEIEKHLGYEILEIAEEIGDEDPRNIQQDLGDTLVFCETGSWLEVSEPDDDLSREDVQASIMLEFSDLDKMTPKEAIGFILKSDAAPEEKLEKISDAYERMG